MGLIIGIVVGLFRAPFVETVLYGIEIGGAAGLAAGALGLIADKIRRRSDPSDGVMDVEMIRQAQEYAVVEVKRREASRQGVEPPPKTKPTFSPFGNVDLVKVARRHESPRLNAVLGVLGIAAIMGVGLVYQFAYGEIRPFLPEPVRSVVGGDKELEAQEYLGSIFDVLTKFFDTPDECGLNQMCRTRTAFLF